MTALADRPSTAARDNVLEIQGLRTHFTVDDGVVRAVDGVDFSLPRGRTVCVVGESGCGKSMTARSVLGLIEHPGRIVDGHIWFRPSDDAAVRTRREATRAENDRCWDPDGRVDLTALDTHGEALRRIRGKDISMIFQEPMASLSPMYTVANQLTEVLRLHRGMTARDAFDRGVSLLERVGIPRAKERMDSYPFQLSGGMCQRVMIAIALACEPDVLIADEPTTALDVTTQARIIDLLAELQSDTGMALMFITHDLGVVAEIADEVVVMYLGTVAEQAPVDDIFHRPQHPYTRALLESLPTMGTGARRRLNTIRGRVPAPLDRPSGCPFHPRCREAVTGVCDTIDPPMVTLGPGRARCVLHQPDLLPTSHRSEQR